jgi:hypothetical protein
MKELKNVKLLGRKQSASICSPEENNAFCSCFCF